MAPVDAKQDTVEYGKKEVGSKMGSFPSKLIITDLCLRIILFASSLTALVVMVTSTQTLDFFTLLFQFSITAQYTDSPALIYIVVALSISIAYSFFTSLGTIWILVKRCSFKSLLNFYLVFIVTDVVMVGLVAAATGAAGTVGDVGLEGNSHVGWTKICNIFGKFCTYVGASIIISLFDAFLLALLVVLSACSVYRLAHKALKLN